MMQFVKIQDTIDKFVKFKVKDIKKDSTYNPKIISFMNYLVEFKNIELRNDWFTDLGALSYLDIKDSMRYYIWNSKTRSKQVTSKGNLETYLIVLKEYFRFLHNNNISNERLLAWFDLWETDNRSIESVIDEIVKEEQLRGIEVMKPLTEHELILLNQLCNNHINQFSESDIYSGKKNTKYRYYLSSLICKLILETGIKYKVIKTLRTNDLDIKEGIIKLHNKYELKLSAELNKQLSKYIDIRSKILNDNLNNSLFVHVTNELDPGLNTYISVFIQKIGRNDTTGMGKTKILSMMNQQIPEILIREITSFDSKVIEDCKRRLVNYKEDYRMINEYINKAFVSRIEEGPYIT